MTLGRPEPRAPAPQLPRRVGHKQRPFRTVRPQEARAFAARAAAPSRSFGPGSGFQFKGRRGFQARMDYLLKELLQSLCSAFKISINACLLGAETAPWGRASLE